MYYMGVDVGSVSTNIVLLDNTLKVIEKLYLRTKGKPIKAIQDGFKILSEKYDSKQISSVGTTGSGRHMASFLMGGDVIKNEITAHAVAALEIDKEVSTILEIGGQDSKIILLKNGIVTDFAMNTVCAAGTGSFLDRQAERLEIPIEKFGEYALKSKAPVRIAGRCAVFAESDMIHKQQLGYNEEDIIGGLCEALVRNYLSNVGKGKEIRSKIFFQGGVAANKGIKTAFEKALGTEICVPEHYDVMGAIGAAILAKEELVRKEKTNFKGFEIATNDFVPRNIDCNGCGNNCEVIAIKDGEKTVGCFGDRCGKWSSKMVI